MEAHELQFLIAAAPKNRTARAAIECECDRLFHIAATGAQEQHMRAEQFGKVLDDARHRYWPYYEAERLLKLRSKRGRKKFELSTERPRAADVISAATATRSPARSKTKKRRSR